MAPFRVVEYSISPNYLRERFDQKKNITYHRKDYDIALLRIDYPIIDEQWGK